MPVFRPMEVFNTSLNHFCARKNHFIGCLSHFIARPGHSSGCKNHFTASFSHSYSHKNHSSGCSGNLFSVIRKVSTYPLAVEIYLTKLLLATGSIVSGSGKECLNSTA